MRQRRSIASPSPRSSRGEGWGEGLSRQARLAESPLTRRFAPTSPRRRGEVDPCPVPIQLAREPRQKLQRVAAFDVHQLRVGEDAESRNPLTCRYWSGTENPFRNTICETGMMAVSRDIAALFEVCAVFVVEALQLGQRPLRHRRLGARSSSGLRTKRSIRNGIVPPACENIQRMSGNLRALPLKTMSAMARRGVGAEFDHHRRLGADQVDAGNCRGRVGVDQRLAPVELCHNRQKQGVAEPFISP